MTRTDRDIRSSGFTLPRRNVSRRTVLRAGLPGAAALLAGGSALRAPAMAQDDEVEAGVEISIPLDLAGQEFSPDPHRAVDWSALWVSLPYVWSGLLAFDENGAVVTDLAESFEPGDTADTWTAVLREDLTFANGTAITAEACINSWKRALDPNNVAPMAKFFEPVAGYAEFIAGTSGDLGFEATDERTIEITLSKPLASFPAMVATFGWAVVDTESAAEPEFWLQGASAGQWQISEFVDGEHVALVPNESYWDGVSPSVSKVTFLFLDGLTAATSGIELYQQDQIVSLDVPLSQQEAVQAEESLAAELVTIDLHGSTISIGMDFNQAPFDDVRIRRAVASAIDKSVWAEEIWSGAWAPANSFTPPSIAQIANYEPPAAIAFDPDAARELLEDADFTTGDEQTVEVVYHQPATDSDEEIQRHAALLAMIQENSGLVITHDTSLTRDQIAALAGDNGGRQFDLVWWWPTSITPELLGKVGSSESMWNLGWFNWNPELEDQDDSEPGDDSEEFDELIVEAEAELDEETRNEAYAEAESLLLSNAVLIPLGHWVQRYLQKPWLQGTRQGPWSGRIPVRIDKDVVVVGRAVSTPES